MDWNLPTLSDLYTDFLTYIKGRDTDLAKGLDPAKVTVTNPVTDMIRWNSANAKWEIYNGSTWGDLASSYTINVTHLGGQAASAYALLASPALTGNPTAPTQAVDNNTTRLATTAYVINQGYLKSATAASTYAPLASPALTGNPTAPTQSNGNSSTRLATTAFVQDALSTHTFTNPAHTDQTLNWSNGGTTAWNMANGGIATLSASGASGNTTLGAPTNLKKGVYVLHFIQGATARTITWNSVFKWPGGVAPTLSTTSGHRDVFTFVCDGTNLFGSQALGYTS